MLTRIGLFVVFTFLIWLGVTYFDTATQPDYTTRLSLDAVNGGTQAADELRLHGALMKWVSTIAVVVNIAFTILIFRPQLRQLVNKLEIWSGIATGGLLLCLITTGCAPYDTPAMFMTVPTTAQPTGK